MAKRSQQESGEERVTANSRPMMNLTARMTSIVSSSTLSNPGGTSYGYQDPGKSVAGDDRSGKPDRLSPTGYSKMDYGRSWSSQEWRSEAAAHDRSGKPDETSWNTMQQVRPHHEEPLLDGNAQSVRYGEIIHDGSGQLDSVNYQEEAESDTLVMGSDAAGKNSWRQLSLIGDETVINLQRTKVYVFSDSVLCLGKIHQHPESNEAWKNRIEKGHN